MNNEPKPVEATPSRTERLVGVFIVLAIVLLLVGFAYFLYHTAERKGWRVPRCPYFTFVQSAEGLEVGDPVKMMGFDIGEISVIEAQPPASYYNIYVGITIRRPYYGYIWADSKVRIASAGLLGRRQLEITKGYAGAPTVYDKHDRPDEILVDGKRTPLAAAPKGPFLIPEEMASVSDRADKLLADIQAALPGVLLLTNRLNGVLDNTSVLLTSSTGLVHNLDQTIAQLPPVLSNVAVITANLRNPQGSLGDWLVPVDLRTNLNAQLTLLAGDLNNILLHVSDITSNLNQQVQSNDQILSNISTLVVDTDNLVQGLKRHWLLRGAFATKPATTNAPPKK